MVIKVEPQRLERRKENNPGKEMVVSRKVSFGAAHFLPNYEGKCRNMHGHTWVVELGVKGLVSKDGMVIDFTRLSSFLEDNVVEVFDHRLVNDIIPNPTAENIALYIKECCGWIGIAGCRLAFIKVWETEDSMAMLEGDR